MDAGQVAATAAPVAVSPVVRRYDWGSTTYLQGLLGASVDGQPWAELWLGAHPAGPSPLPGGGTLADRAPDLPFLVKVLAADAPLSLQVHPDAARARAGFAREEAAGVGRDEATRSYRDESHKPELLVALEPTDALAGFRPPGQAADALARLAVPGLGGVTAALRVADEAAALRGGLVALLALADQPAVVAAAAAAATTAAEQGGTQAPALRWVAQLAARHPTDPGALAPLLLHLVTLAPGEGLFVPAGTLHAYLAGAGVEVQASSDNVLRAGLTTKHVDARQLLAVLDAAARPVPLVHPVPHGPGLAAYPVPVPDFRCWSVEVGAAALALPGAGPRLVVAVAGRLRVGDVDVPPGHGAYLEGTAPVVVTGPGRGFVVGAGG